MFSYPKNLYGPSIAGDGPSIAEPNPSIGEGRGFLGQTTKRDYIRDLIEAKDNIVTFFEVLLPCLGGNALRKVIPVSQTLANSVGWKGSYFSVVCWGCH